MRTIITTVGTSLLTNDDRDLPKNQQRPWAGWRFDDPLPEAATVQTFLETADEQRLCAESNTLRALPARENDRLMFFHTQTPDGRFCAEVLQRLFQAQGFEARVREIEHLGYGERAFQDRGLKALVSALFEEVSKSERAGRVPVFCATGGFKAEIAMVNLVGVLRGIEVCYMHEKFRELIRFPALPLDWNTDVVARNLDFFDWIDSEPRESGEVESRLHNHPDVRLLVETTEDGCAVLSTAGDLLFQAYKNRTRQLPPAIWPPASMRSPAEKNGLSGVAHHRPEGWEKTVDLLCRIDCVHHIRYEGSAPSGNRSAGVLKTDEEGGILAVYEKQGKRLPLWVETTARGAAQTQLVADYIARRMKV